MSAASCSTAQSCRCTDYKHRTDKVKDCVRLTPRNIRRIVWLPPSCGYRLVADGKDLYWWHPLVSGDPETVHIAGVSVRGRVGASEEAVRDEELEDRIVDWPLRLSKAARGRRRRGRAAARVPDAVQRACWRLPSPRASRGERWGEGHLQDAPVSRGPSPDALRASHRSPHAGRGAPAARARTRSRVARVLRRWRYATRWPSTNSAGPSGGRNVTTVNSAAGIVLGDDDVDALDPHLAAGRCGRGRSPWGSRARPR